MRTFVFANGAVAAASAALAVLALPAPVSPALGPYTIEGGTSFQRAQVRQALAASAFDWAVVPTVVIRIRPGSVTWARRGEIRLSAELLDTGRASWGIVQHEFAHQVDLLLLDDVTRSQLGRQLGGAAWWPSDAPGRARGAYTAERFASTLAWAYWPSRHNVMRPHSRNDESAAMDPAEFRAMLAWVLATRVGR